MPSFQGGFLVLKKMDKIVLNNHNNSGYPKCFTSFATLFDVLWLHNPSLRSFEKEKKSDRMIHNFNSSFILLHQLFALHLKSFKIQNINHNNQKQDLGFRRELCMITSRICLVITILIIHSIQFVKTRDG